MIYYKDVGNNCTVGLESKREYKEKYLVCIFEVYSVKKLRVVV